jgi:hypothetical protein
MVAGIFVSGFVGRDQSLPGAAPDRELAGLEPQTVRLILIGSAACCWLFGATLITLALLAHRGRNGARIALTVIGGIVVVAGMAYVVTGFAIGFYPVLYIGIAVTLFWTGNTTGWYRAQAEARRGASRPVGRPH